MTEAVQSLLPYVEARDVDNKRFERRVIVSCVIHLKGAELMFNVIRVQASVFHDYARPKV